LTPITRVPCGSCEVLPNDSFDRRLPQKEKTDETKKTLRRLDVRVLRIETAYAWVLPARLRDQKERKWWNPSEFCSLQQTRTRDSFSPTQPGINNPLCESTSRRNLLSRQPCPRIAEPGWRRVIRKASLMQDHAKRDSKLANSNHFKCTVEAVQTFLQAQFV
jgi:hypothetical protein